MMHFTEAYLAAAQVAEPAWFGARLRGLAQAMMQHFMHPRVHTIAEATLCSQESAIEPGHQFEWFSLVSGAPEVFEGLGLALYLPRPMQWARQAGVDPATQGVYASLGEHGSVRDTTQRIWAQAEYARALALAGDWVALEKQLGFFSSPVFTCGWLVPMSGSPRTGSATRYVIHHALSFCPLLRGLTHRLIVRLRVMRFLLND